jgi:hypothetical protein
VEIHVRRPREDCTELVEPLFETVVVTGTGPKACSRDCTLVATSVSCAQALIVEANTTIMLKQLIGTFNMSLLLSMLVDCRKLTWPLGLMLSVMLRPKE